MRPEVLACLAGDINAEYNAYGEELERPGAAVTRFGYQGTAWMRLPIGGEAYLLSPHGVYLPKAGMHLQRDPFRRLAPRSSAYQYVRGNPIAAVDPAGLLWTCIDDCEDEGDRIPCLPSGSPLGEGPAYDVRGRTRSPYVWCTCVCGEVVPAEPRHCHHVIVFVPGGTISGIGETLDEAVTYYHYDEANELLMSHEYGPTNIFHFFEYDANGSMEHDSKVETAANVLLDCEYEGTTDGAVGEQATVSGTIAYEPGELPGTEAVRVAVDGGSTGTISYGATGNLADGEGTVLLRVKNDDWDSGSHTTQYLLELWLDSTHYIRIWLDASAGVLHADGKDANKTWALEADASEWLDGSWYDIVLAYATRDERLYVNGAPEDSDAAKDIPTGLTDIYVGADSGGSNHWYGLVDEFLTFDSALTATEVANLSNRTGGASNTTYFEYADSELVKKITPGTGTPTQFHYDARLRRFGIDWAGTVSYYAWDGMNQLIEKNADGSTAAQHTHGHSPIEGIGTVIVSKRSGEYQYPHYDQRGSLFDLEDTGAADTVLHLLHSVPGGVVAVLERVGAHLNPSPLRLTPRPRP